METMKIEKPYIAEEDCDSSMLSYSYNYYHSSFTNSNLQLIRTCINLMEC